MRLPILFHRPASPVVVVTCLLAFVTPAVVGAQIQPMSGCSGLDIVASPPSANRHLNTGSFSLTFTVTNCSAGTIGEIELFCEVVGPVTCDTMDPTTYGPLAPSASFQVSVTYSAGIPGLGEVRLRADWPPNNTAYGIHYVTVTGSPTVTLVAPILTSGSRAVVRSRTPVVRAFFVPQYSGVDSTTILLQWGNDTVTRFQSDSLRVARFNRGLVEWEVDSVRGLNGSGADSALITVKACALSGQCTTLTCWAVLPNDSTPVVGVAAGPLGSTGGGFSAPFGPGISVSGAEVETGFATVPYFALGAPRSAGLVYSTRQSYPRVLVPLEIELRWPTTGNPDQLVARLLDGAVKLDSLKLTSPTCATGTAKKCRAVLQGDFSGSTFTTPTRKWLRVEVAVTKSGVTRTSLDSVEAVLVDRRSTMYGSGWWPAGLIKLVTAGGDRLLVGPTGTAAIYRGNGDSLYLPPPGSFTLLTRTASGWELRARGDNGVTRFDSYGRLRAAVDRNGNRDSVAYGNAGLDTLKKVVGPTGHALTFAYTSGKLATVTDPGGRQTKITINGSNQLTYDSLSSPTARSWRTTYVYQSYPGTNTVVLTKRIGVILDTTIVVYDSTFRRRPKQALLPLVKDPAGSWVKPAIAYVPVESRGYGALVRVDSAGPYVEMKDPLGNWTRSWLNRWGQVRLTWDTLGLLGRTTFHPDGHLWYAEGKNGDSSRVYTRYDNQFRPVKTFYYRGNASSLLRVDSLVYDASHRVTERIDARGKITRYFYDAAGNDTMVVTPNSDTTRVTRNADGTVFAVREPGDTGRTRYYYDGTWRNLLRVTTPSGDTVASNAYDSHGRLTSSDRKQIVQTVDETSGTTGVQWRHSETFYTVANEVDSTRLSRSDTCTGSGCSLPGSWSWDAQHSMREGQRFDRAGRDSVRLDGTGRETVRLYDRLGRLWSRRPPSDSAPAPRDSMVYDAAGRLVKRISRSGDTVTVAYDSRNRDTATVIPRVGILRKAFAGPQDQLTRLWYASPMDSIGGVNGELRWGYDARGRLRADTAYRGATVLATTRSYDQFERDSAMTDPRGTWRYSYHADHGRLQQMTTPGADTVVYGYDARGRVTGVWAWRNGVKTRAGYGYNLDGALTALADSAWAPGGGYDLGRYAEQITRDDGQVARLPLWIQDQDATPWTTPDTLADSLAYDGWERLRAWSQNKNGTPLASYSYDFDTYGNLTTPTGAEVYGAKTDRLLERTDPATGHLWRYFYDRAGSLVSARDSTPGGSAVVWSFAYDGLGQLRTVARSDLGVAARYGYDVLGRRVVKRVYTAGSGGTVQYLRMVYHGAQVVFETDSGGTVGWQYVWGLGTDRLLVARQGASTYWTATDKLGSVRAHVGTAQGYRWYTPYAEGTTTEGTWAGLRYGWTGREYDAETGFYYLRARYYDPKQRRFTQEDPLGYWAGPNLYSYVGGAVLEARDPSGLYSEYPRSFGAPVCGGGSCYMQGIYIDGVFHEGWSTEMISDNSMTGMWIIGDAALHYTWDEKCNRPAGCVVYDRQKVTDQARAECGANPHCAELEYNAAHGGRLIVAGTNIPGISCDRGSPGCTNPNGSVPGGLIINLVPGAIAEALLSLGLKFEGGLPGPLDWGVILTHELGHVLAVANGHGVRSPMAGEIAVYWENRYRESMPMGGRRLYE